LVRAVGDGSPPPAQHQHHPRRRVVPAAEKIEAIGRPRLVLPPGAQGPRPLRPAPNPNASEKPGVGGLCVRPPSGSKPSKKKTCRCFGKSKKIGAERRKIVGGPGLRPLHSTPLQPGGPQQSPPPPPPQQIEGLPKTTEKGQRISPLGGGGGGGGGRPGTNKFPFWPKNNRPGEGPVHGAFPTSARFNREGNGVAVTETERLFRTGNADLFLRSTCPHHPAPPRCLRLIRRGGGWFFFFFIGQNTSGDGLKLRAAARGPDKPGRPKPRSEFWLGPGPGLFTGGFGGPHLRALGPHPPGRAKSLATNQTLGQTFLHPKTPVPSWKTFRSHFRSTPPFGSDQAARVRPPGHFSHGVSARTLFPAVPRRQKQQRGGNPLSKLKTKAPNFGYVQKAPKAPVRIFHSNQF